MGKEIHLFSAYETEPKQWSGKIMKQTNPNETWEEEVQA